MGSTELESRDQKESPENSKDYVSQCQNSSNFERSKRKNTN